MKQAKPKLKWVEKYPNDLWYYQADDGTIFGGVQKTGGAMSRPYHPIQFWWFVGPYQYAAGELRGLMNKRSEAQRHLESIYQQYQRIKQEAKIETKV
jgi:hypothetical protein